MTHFQVDYFEVTLDKGIDEPYLGGDPIKGIIEMVCSKQVRITGLIVRLTGVAETGGKPYHFYFTKCSKTPKGFRLAE